MVVTFYRVNDDPRKLEKTLGTALGTASGQLHKRTNNLQLDIKMPGTFHNIITQSNYVMLDLFQKYYYCENYDIENDCVIIHLKEDVRMSWATQIKRVNTTISRNSREYNGYLKDKEYNALAYEGIQYKEFPNALDDASCILVTVG